MNIDKYLNERNQFNPDEIIAEGRKQLAAQEEQKKRFSAYLDSLAEPDQELKHIMNATAETVQRDKEEEAQRLIAREQAAACREIEKRIRKELNVETETELDRAYKKLLSKD